MSGLLRGGPRARRWARASTCAVAAASDPGRAARSRRACARRWSACARTSSTTSRRRRSCRTRGSDPAQTLAAIAGATRGAAGGGARAGPRDPRVRGQSSGAMFGAAAESPQREETLLPAGEPVRDREARDAPAGRGAARARRAVRVLGDPLQPRVRAPPGAVRDAQDHARGGGGEAGSGAARWCWGTSSAVRDWSFAGDIVRGARLMLQQDAPRRLHPRQRQPAHGRRARATRRSPAWASRPSATCASSALVRAPSRRRSSAIREGAARAGLAAQLELRGARGAHGARRPGGADSPSGRPAPP